jgi:hypothetical protein
MFLRQTLFWKSVPIYPLFIRLPIVICTTSYESHTVRSKIKYFFLIFLKWSVIKVNISLLRKNKIEQNLKPNIPVSDG